MSRIIDPFGAQEIFANGVCRRKICDEVVRLTFWSADEGQRIARVRVLMTIHDIVSEQTALREFMAGLVGVAHH